jgi:hypothetical protein
LQHAAEAANGKDIRGGGDRTLHASAHSQIVDGDRSVWALGRVWKSRMTQLKPALMQMGMSSDMADLLLEMAEALNSGYMRMLEPRSPENTTPTTLETFVAQVFVPAYRGKSAGA